MKISILSFSFKRGLPEDPTGNGGGFVFDCRAMPNPFWDETLRGCTGRDEAVKKFFARIPKKVEPFLDAAELLIRQSVEQYRQDGRGSLQVAFGCTGGQHRSVYFAEQMAGRLSNIDDVDIQLNHSAQYYWKTITN